MSITAAALWTNARAKIGLNFDDGRLGDTNIAGVLVAMNAGLADLSTDRDWDWLYAEGTISVVSGTETYAVPSNYLRTLWIADPFGELLTLKQRRHALRYTGVSANTRFYSVANGLIYLSPVPNQTATFRHGYYTHIPAVAGADLTALGSVTLNIPDLFLPLAALFVAKHIAIAFKDFDAYKLVEAEIQNERQRIGDNARRSLGPIIPSTRSDY